MTSLEEQLKDILRQESDARRTLDDINRKRRELEAKMEIKKRDDVRDEDKQTQALLKTWNTIDKAPLSKTSDGLVKNWRVELPFSITREIFIKMQRVMSNNLDNPFQFIAMFDLNLEKSFFNVNIYYDAEAKKMIEFWGSGNTRKFTGC